MITRCGFFAPLLLVLLCHGLRAEEVGSIMPGQDVVQVARAMKESGYRETAIAMMPKEKGSELKMWEVGEGVLIVSFSTKEKKVTNLSYFFCDERPKATRKTFEFPVTEFHPRTGEMKLRLPLKRDGGVAK